MTSIGLSAYAIMNPHYPYKRLLRCFPPRLMHPAMAILWATFGYDLRGVKAYCDMFKDRKHILECHISNECSRRTGRPGKEIADYLSVLEYSKALRSENGTAINKQVRMAIRQRVAEVLAALKPVINGNTVLVLSGGLESDLPGTALSTLHRIIKNNSRLPLVYSANGHPDGMYRANYLESHSPTPSNACAYWNLDGTSLNFNDGEKYEPKISPEHYLENFKKYNDGKEAIFLWSAYQQGLSGLGLGASYENRNFIVTDQAIHGMKKLLKEMSTFI